MTFSIIETKSDVKETITDFLLRADSFEGVMLVGLNKDGSQFMMSSTMSAMKKCFLISFVQSWLLTWFKHQHDESAS